MGGGKWASPMLLIALNFIYVYLIELASQMLGLSVIWRGRFVCLPLCLPVASILLSCGIVNCPKIL